MDPVSGAASAVAFIQAAAAIGQGIKILASLTKAPAEFCALLNELTTLQSLASQVQESPFLHRDETLQIRSSDAIHVEKLMNELSETVGQLEVLVKRFVDGSKGFNKHGQLRISAVGWRVERENIYQLRDKARQTREYLSVFMTSWASSESSKQTKLILQVEQVLKVSSNDLGYSVKENLSLSRNAQSSLLRLEASVAALQTSHLEPVQQLKSLIRSVHAPREFSQETSEAKGCSGLVSSGPDTHPEPAIRPPQRIPQDGHPDTLGSSDDAINLHSIICFRTSIRPTCVAACKCQCHRTSSIVSPKYLQGALGAFFVSYNAIPIFGHISCDFANCRSASRSRLQFYYHLPAWLLSRAILFTASWDTVVGVGADLHIKVPRVIKPHDPIWELIRCGDLDKLRQRFATRLSAPADVAPNGMSPFQYAITRGNRSVVEFLLQIGCDVAVKALDGRILTSHIKPLSERLIYLYKVIMQLDEDRQCFHSTLVHDSLLGLNNLTLEESVAIEPRSVNCLDGMGYSPLHWAVKLRKDAAITSLINLNVSPDIRDLNRRTALHLAAHYGLLHICRRLLQAGCNANARDISGKTALHQACGSSSPESLEIVRELLRHGSLPNSPDNTNRFTPLNHLVHESLARDPWDCEGKIDALLAAGANIDEPDKWGCPPLLNSAAIPWDNELFRLLYDRGADASAVNGLGRSVLHYAAAYGDLDHLEYLRGLGISGLDPDGRDHYRHTPTSLMMWRSRTTSVKLWANMRRPTEEEIASFHELIADLRTRCTAS